MKPIFPSVALEGGRLRATKRRRTAAALVLLLSAGLAVPSVVGAAQSDKGLIHLTAAGQAAAKKAVLGRSDLGSNWLGGSKKPDLNESDPVCKNGFHAKSSDLTTIGAARSEWDSPLTGANLESQVEVLETQRMVKLDFQRSFASPKAIECMRALAAKTAAKNGVTLVSLKPVAFPKVTRFTYALRLVVEGRNGTKTIRIISDNIMFGHGRTEHTLSITAAASTGGPSRSLEVKLARKLVNRAS